MEFMSLSDLGKVNKFTQDFVLGQRGRFLDDNQAATSIVKPSLSMMEIEALFVRNETGGTLPAGTIVTWDTGATYGPGKAVGGTAGATSLGAGVVNPYISTAVPDNGYFWLIVKGPAKFLFTTGTALAPADGLAVAASGRVGKVTIGTTNGVYFIGTSLATVASGTASGTLFRGRAHFPFA